MCNLIVESRYRELFRLDNNLFTEEKLLREPNLSLCEIPFALSHCGDALSAIIEAVTPHCDTSSALLTCRIAELRAGEYPHYLDWHCDGHLHGQLLSQSEMWPYIMGHVGTAICDTEMIDQDVELPDMWFNGDDTYRTLSTHINAMSHINTVRIEPGIFVNMHATDIHRGAQCTKRGIRCFIVINYPDAIPANMPLNQIRRTTTVYHRI